MHKLLYFTALNERKSKVVKLGPSLQMIPGSIQEQLPNTKGILGWWLKIVSINVASLLVNLNLFLGYNVKYCCEYQNQMNNQKSNQPILFDLVSKGFVPSKIALCKNTNIIL